MPSRTRSSSTMLVVTAGLVGALALGGVCLAAPVPALAGEATPAPMASESVTYTVVNRDDGTSRFTYDGEPADVKLLGSDGSEVTSGLTFYVDGEPDGSGSSEAPTAAGQYSVWFQDASGSLHGARFAIDRLDLARTPVFAWDYESNSAPDEGRFLEYTVNGKELSRFAEVVSVAGPGGTESFGDAVGRYTVHVRARDVDGGSVIGEVDVSYYVVDRMVTGNPGYGDTPLQEGPTGMPAYYFNLSAGQAFDVSKARFTDLDGNVYEGDRIEVTCLDSLRRVVAPEALAKPGQYEVNIRLTPFEKDGELLGGYVGGYGVYVVTEAETPFDDVPGDSWYAKVVAQAASLGYVKGYAGTRNFGPKAWITRADAICVLFNMANGKVGASELEQNSTDGYVTGFSDVDGHAYYAKALAWAKASGIANGYPDGTFGPGRNISREEFVALLSNYAKAAGTYVEPTRDALSGMLDNQSVSAWAWDVVNWGVVNKIIGNNGAVHGRDYVTRAEVAAMAVNYQPERLG